MTLVTGGALSIGQAVTAVTGTVRLTTVGGVSQTAAITAGSLGVRNTTSGNIALTSVANNVATFAASNTVAGGTIQYTDANGLTIGTVTADGTLFTPTTVGITTNAAVATIKFAQASGAVFTLLDNVSASSFVVEAGTAGSDFNITRTDSDTTLKGKGSDTVNLSSVVAPDPK